VTVRGHDDSEGVEDRATGPLAEQSASGAKDLVKVKLIGLPEDSEVTFAGRHVPKGVIRGKAGERDLLLVQAKGYAQYQEQLTLEEGGAIDLAGKIRRMKRPSGKRQNTGRAPRDEFIHGDRGAKIFSQPLEID